MSQVQDPPIVASQSAIIEAHSTEDLRQQVRAVVHDFNDILGVIVGYSELLLRNIQEDDPARKGIAEIRRAADRGVSLTQSLLRSYRNEALELEVLDINELLQYSQPFFERLIGDGLELHIVFGDNLDPVRLNRSQAEQVITNLLTNARDAMPTGGRLIVESAALELTEEHSEIHLGIPAGRYTTLAVIDTGVGMECGDTALHLRTFLHDEREEARDRHRLSHRESDLETERRLRICRKQSWCRHHIQDLPASSR